MRSAILTVLTEEIKLHQNISENNTWLKNAVDAAFDELRMHGVREAGERRALELPLFRKIRFIVDVLKTVPDDQFKRLMDSNNKLFTALNTTNYLLQIERTPNTQTKPSVFDRF
jgi:hypothetical protein